MTDAADTGPAFHPVPAYEHGAAPVPLIKALTEELVGAIGIDASWFGATAAPIEVHEDGTATATVALYGEDGETIQDVRIRIAVESLGEPRPAPDLAQQA